MLELGILAFLLVLGYTFGSINESNHIQSLRRRERHQIKLVSTQVDQGPKLISGETFLVCASVVIASDYFKNFVGTLRNFFGGRLKSHESLLDRARREALCRVRELAHQKGANKIVNLRLETSFLDQLGIEVSAYGTAVKDGSIHT